jgi:protoporphyrinogen/coproporphyrinogen III oxidase
MGHKEKTVVIGAGITGLTCAYSLQRWGLPVLVLEASNHPGGLISTTCRKDFLFESGPQCPRFNELLWKLIGELNLASEFVGGNPRAKRYIVKNGRLCSAPLSPGSLIGTRLLGLNSKLRILSEPLGFSHPPANEETVADFVIRKFGQEILDYLVDPILSTVFFGDARKMGMESAFPALVRWERENGSLARGALAARKSRPPVIPSPGLPEPGPGATGARLNVADSLPALGSFRRGMGTLPSALAERLGGMIRFGARTESLSLAGGKGPLECLWKLRLEGGEEILAENLVMAVPAFEAARLLTVAATHLSSLLAAIPYAPMAVVSAGFNRRAVQHRLDGFGFMVPRREGMKTFCTIWNSSLFEGRAPEGRVLMTSYVGASPDDGLLALTDEALTQTVHAETEKILGATGQPVERQIWKYPLALPQYNLGHAERVAAIRTALGAFPNLHLVGNYLEGRSIGDCAEMGFRAAESLRFHFRS